LKLFGGEALERVVAELPPYRERVFPPLKVLSMFCAQALAPDGSCQRAVDALALERTAQGAPPCSSATGGYCRARERLPLAVPQTLARALAEAVLQATPRRWLWCGRRVWLVDGTTLSMPDTFENRIRWPQSPSQAPGLGFPQCRLAVLTDLSGGAIGNAAIGACEGKGGDEQALLREIRTRLGPGDVLVGDAYFPTYFGMAWLVAHGIDGVFEQYGARRRTTDFARGQPLGERDRIAVWIRPERPDWMTPAEYAHVPQTLQVRELAVARKILVTTLLRPQVYPKPAIGALYKERWNVEPDLRNLKTTLGMDPLSCKSPAMVEKEIWVYLLAYNLIRLLVAQSAALADCLPRRIAFKHAVQIWAVWAQCVAFFGTAPALRILLLLIAQRRVGQRPGRIEPRALKRRPRNYPLLMEPRPLARAEVRAHGHPKKAN
jgi:hypothetical protein